jgi:dissimilatory sulfite reductase (desulfoviridin) alpha/beta subunit
MKGLFDFAKELALDRKKITFENGSAVEIIDLENVEEINKLVQEIKLTGEQHKKQTVDHRRDAALWEMNLAFEKARRGEHDK